MTEPVWIFAGPSTYGLPFSITTEPGIVWCPPVRRGDIEDLVVREAPGVLAIVDGTFHSYPAVAHVEIREAIEAGWKTFGLSSMGAIRAAEMHHLGLQPWGQVAEHFVGNPATPDDEVALLHGQDKPFLHLSEPLVHIRAFFAHLGEQGMLESQDRESLELELASLWFGDRTLQRVRYMLARLIQDEALRLAVMNQMSDFQRFRLKQIDLLSFLRERPWEGTKAI